MDPGSNEPGLNLDYVLANGLDIFGPGLALVWTRVGRKLRRSRRRRSEEIG